MPNPPNAKKPISRKEIEDEVLTRGKLIAVVEDLKDFIRITSKGTENVLRAEIQSVRTELKTEIQSVRTDLTAKIQSVQTDLTAKIQVVDKNLSEKIDKSNSRMEDHEARISTLETARL